MDRLFRFVEIESNISLHQLDSNYQKLKDKIQQLVVMHEKAYQTNCELLKKDDIAEIKQRKVFVRKRGAKAKAKENQQEMPSDEKKESSLLPSGKNSV